MKRILGFLLASAVGCGCTLFQGALTSGSKYVSEFDLSAASAGMGKRVTPVGTSFRTHPESAVAFRANGKVSSFEATLAIPPEALKDKTSGREIKAVCRVWADGKIVWKSGVFTEKSAPVKVKVDLTGAEEIVLETTSTAPWVAYEATTVEWRDAVFNYCRGAILESVTDPTSTMQYGVLTPAEKAEPQFNGAEVWGVRPGHPVIFRVPVSGVRPMTFSAKGLPAGVTFDATRGIIGGTAPLSVGDYPIVVTASNAKGTASKTIVLKVGDTICLTPPMGWNSWNIYAGAVTDEKIRYIARSMDESGLADHGWAYVNIDDWWMKNKGDRAKDKPEHAGPARDAAGRFVPQANFPDMKALGDYIHSLGLKYGIYSSPGETTCGGCEGSLGHEAIDAKTWADWGVDYLKHDWCSYGKVFSRETKGRKPTVDDYAKPYRLMSKCLRAQNRDILHAFCQYGMGDVQSWGEEAGAQVWRSWGDLKDNWTCVLNATESYAEAYKFTRPGFWCDPDMMVVGYLNTDFGMHESFLSNNEQYTHMSLWCLLNAPLLLGCDLGRMSDFTKGLVMNDEILAINQDALGRQAGRVAHDEATDVWWRPLANGDSAYGVVNRRPFSRKIVVRFADAGLAEGEYDVRDLWRQQDLGRFRGEIEVEVPGHATAVLRLKSVCTHCESRKR